MQFLLALKKSKTNQQRLDPQKVDNMPFDNIVTLNSNREEIIFPPLAKCAFTAKHVDLNFDHEDTIKTVPSQLARAVIRTDTGAALGLTGNRYGIAQNLDVHAVLVESLERSLPASFLKDIELTEQTSGAGAFCKFTYTFPSAAEPIRQLRDSTGFKSDRYGDEHKETWLNLQFSCINSFGGKTPLILTSGIRDISCLNSLTTAYTEGSASQRHNSQCDPARFGEFIEHQAASFQERIAVWQGWADRSLTPETAEATLEAAGVSPRLTKQLMRTFEDEAAKRGRSVWALASALTFWSSHSSDDYGVRGSKNSDNVAASLHTRGSKVNAVMASEAWHKIAA